APRRTSLHSSLPFDNGVATELCLQPQDGKPAFLVEALLQVLALGSLLQPELMIKGPNVNFPGASPDVTQPDSPIQAARRRHISKVAPVRKRHLRRMKSR